MISTILNAMLPIVVTLVLGMVAAWHQDFDADGARVLNRMVMIYALPLVLFTGILSTPRSQLVGHTALTAVLVLSLLASYVIPFVIARYAVGRDLMSSALQALAIGCPNLGFVGLPVLGYLFGPSVASISVAVSSLVLVVFHIPVTMMLLAAGAARRGDASGPPVSLPAQIVATLKEPMVWGPLLGFVMVLLEIPLPTALMKSFDLLGAATAGVALFSSGITLYSQRVMVSVPIAITTLSRNVLVPAAVWAAVVPLGVISENQMKEAVISLAIPSAVVCVILAVQFRAAEREIASTIFWSTILSLPTVGLFIWLLGA
ncbi:MAG: AEC family transporter [Rhodoplanes sp.]|uniref:AEC family transporter n=1 Tax=Rhodoplanes sp. TaxID=1968906 RepID=UPI0017D2A309|nr:AEC family transporter [Rhodoplanes sp.]NVO17893.1 AEC family transporter [Rhodoplanes sp.]